MKLNGSLPFGQVPILEVDGSLTIAQTNSILRYLSKLGGLYPDNPALAAKVDAALDHELDTFISASIALYPTRFGVTLNDEQMAGLVDALVSEIMPRHLGNLERMLSVSSTGWIAGTERPSSADFAWACRLGQFMPEKEALFPEPLRKLEAYPLLQRFLAQFFALPSIKAYYSQ
mmetsp:Transcript_15/g.27  ORF Transcript_15/g.27 Transcript_15/m.27 type:complete len:174 (-) Transcript_15:10-531(-)